MHDAHHMHVFKRLEDIEQEASYLRRWQPRAGKRMQLPCEATSSDMRHDDEVTVRVLHIVEEGHDARVMQCSEEASLVPQDPGRFGGSNWVDPTRDLEHDEVIRSIAVVSKEGLAEATDTEEAARNVGCVGRHKRSR